MTWVWNGTPEIDAESRYPLIIGVAVGTMVAMLCVIALRLYCRIRLVKGMGRDDWAILVSVLSAVPYIIGVVVQTRLGLGLVPSQIPKPNVVNVKLVNYAIRTFYAPATGGYKVALCFTYLRITQHSSMRRYRQVIWGAMALSVAVSFIILMLILIPCNPIHRFWNTNIPGHCLSYLSNYVVVALLNIIVDVFLFFLPIPLVLRLQMDWRHKLGLSCAFLLGLVTTVTSAMRIVGGETIVSSGDTSSLVLWSCAEINVGIITTSVPTLAPLLKKMRSGKSSYRDGPAGYEGNHSSDSKKLESIINRIEGTHHNRGLPPTMNGTYGSEEDMLGDSKTNTPPTLHEPRMGNETVLEGGPDLGWNDDVPLSRIAKTTNVDIVSGPRGIAQSDHAHSNEQRTLRGF